MSRPDRIRWLAREVLPHEADVRRWLLRKVRGLTHTDLDDAIQEAYARLCTVDPHHIGNPRAYFFITARHVIGEALRRSRIVPIETMADIESLNIVDMGVDPERRVSGRDEVDRVRRLLTTLPPKCRQAFELRKFHDLSQREIAQRMSVSESTVEKHLVKALRLIMNAMKEAGPGTGPVSQSRHESRRRER